MDLSKEFEAELERRKTLETLENATVKDFESVKSIALVLYKQVDALRKMLLTLMKENLVGRIEE